LFQYFSIYASDSLSICSKIYNFCVSHTLEQPTHRCPCTKRGFRRSRQVILEDSPWDLLIHALAAKVILAGNWVDFKFEWIIRWYYRYSW